MEDMSKLFDMISKKNKEDVFIRIESTEDKVTQITAGPSLKAMQMMCTALITLADKAGMPRFMIHAILDAVVANTKEGDEEDAGNS